MDLYFEKTSLLKWAPFSAKMTLEQHTPVQTKSEYPPRAKWCFFKILSADYPFCIHKTSKFNFVFHEISTWIEVTSQERMFSVSKKCQ